MGDIDVTLFAEAASGLLDAADRREAGSHIRVERTGGSESAGRAHRIGIRIGEGPDSRILIPNDSSGVWRPDGVAVWFATETRQFPQPHPVDGGCRTVYGRPGPRHANTKGCGFDDASHGGVEQQ